MRSAQCVFNAGMCKTPEDCSECLSLLSAEIVGFQRAHELFGVGDRVVCDHERFARVSIASADFCFDCHSRCVCVIVRHKRGSFVMKRHVL
jgi:hypothetical protein